MTGLLWLLYVELDRKLAAENLFKNNSVEGNTIVIHGYYTPLIDEQRRQGKLSVKSVFVPGFIAGAEVSY